MPRPRRPESFSVRWHSLANPATPSADIMSSPDPLSEAADDALLLPPPPPSSLRRVVARSSLHSPRFGSPRKQTFALRVGDGRSPQRLWVTVEADDALGPARATSRRLFQSSPAVAGKAAAAATAAPPTTTTTVPLQGAVDNAAPRPPATPRRRGRPRRGNGTPMPAAAKRRAATPADARTPRRRRLADAPPGTEASSAKRTPPTRRAAAPEDAPGAAARDQPPAASDTPTLSEDEVELVGASGPPEAAPADHDDDIWMATASGEATPRPAGPPARAPSPPSPWRAAAADAPPPEPAEAQSSDAGAWPADDAMDLAPAASDASSVDEAAGTAPAQRGDDTIAQEEDFSMIFMDSIPSLQGVGQSSVPPTAQGELGEETSLINNTLESLRRRGAASDASSEPPQPAEPPPVPAGSHLAPDELASDEATLPRATPARSTSARSTPARPTSPKPTSARSTPARSPDRGPSPRWSRTTRQVADSSPLRRRVLRHTARQAEESAAVGDADEDPLAASPRAEPGRAYDEPSHAYEDSFSEIPQEILTSAVPRRSDAATPHDTHDAQIGDEEKEGEEEKREEEVVEEDREEEDREEREGQEEEAEDLVEDHEPPRRDDEQAEADGGPAPALGSSASSTARSEAARLPTPDDTPPQPESQHVGEHGLSSDGGSGTPRKPASPAKAPAAAGAPGASAAAPSETAEQPEEAGASTGSREATPVQQDRSPLAGPQEAPQEAWPDKAARPALSAIVRAGRALQSITSDPPSPEGREARLGSPFRSSGSRGSWEGSREGAARSPRRAPSSRSSPGSSMRFSPRSDGALSWVAREGPLSPRLRGDAPLGGGGGPPAPVGGRGRRRRRPGRRRARRRDGHLGV